MEGKAGQQQKERSERQVIREGRTGIATEERKGHVQGGMNTYSGALETASWISVMTSLAF